MRSEKKQKLIDRKAAAEECIDAMGRFILLVDDCPIRVRDAWRVLNEYISQYRVED